MFKNFHENKFLFQGREFLKKKSTFENRDFQNSFYVEHVFSHELKTCALLSSNLASADLKCDIENLINLNRYSCIYRYRYSYRYISKLYRVIVWVCRFHS